MLLALSAVFDRIEAFWEGPRMRKAVAAVLVVSFLGALGAAEAVHRGFFAGALRLRVPHGHFFAVELALYMLLAWEVVGLVLKIAQSISSSAGKQFEIFSLILLRHSFEEFAHFGEPLAWAEVREPVLRMLANGFGALAIFVVLGFFYSAQRHAPITGGARDRESFIAVKKVISLVLLVFFGAIAVRSALHEQVKFFESFYSVLIFADVLLVLLSLRYSSSYQVVFRNSGLAVATVLLRLALAAPAYYNAALGLAAALFALGLTLAFNRFGPVLGEAGSRRADAPPPASRAVEPS